MLRKLLRAMGARDEPPRGETPPGSSPRPLPGEWLEQQLDKLERGMVDEVELVARNACARDPGDAQARYLVGKRVRASGTLFGAHSGHHRTPIVLQVRSIRAIEG